MKNKKLGILATLISVVSNTTPAIAENMQKSENNAQQAVIQKEIKPQLTQKQLLEKTLYLMDNTRSIDELTPQRLEEIYGVKLNFHDYREYGFREVLSETSAYSFQVYRTSYNEAFSRFRIEFGFAPLQLSDKEKFATHEWNVDDFGFKAMDMGFKLEHILALGNLPILEGFRFSKGNVIAEVRMEAAPQLKTSYIKSIRIRFIEPVGE